MCSRILPRKGKQKVGFPPFHFILRGRVGLHVGYGFDQQQLRSVKTQNMVIDAEGAHRSI